MAGVPSQRRPSSEPKKSRVTPTDPRRRLGLRVKELRSEHNLTQEELADRSGLFRTYMSRIESGQANPTLTMLHQIAAAFPVDVRELFAPVGDVVPARVRSVVMISRGRVKR